MLAIGKSGAALVPLIPAQAGIQPTLHEQIGLALGPRFRGGERGGYFFAAKLTPAGGGMSSGTKKSTCSGWLGSTRY
jgi:hypothetical protein